MSRLLDRKEKNGMKEASVKNKEKERLREREKETREREARSSSGHLFTSLSVSATTLCSSCNKSITAKEALSCPGCNVTIHNRCRDSVASCAKMKQRQQKLMLVRNNSALQNVALRTKTPMMKERPSSAIYPSDTLRQSLLGSRRVRSGLTLAKSVSTNNIAGGTEDSVGLRRILSQSTESLNFRNRTLSMESLTDDSEWWWSPLLEEMQKEGSCVQGDSWSMAVDSKFLQTQHKDVIKQQDVIYGTTRDGHTRGNIRGKHQGVTSGGNTRGQHQGPKPGEKHHMETPGAKTRGKHQGPTPGEIPARHVKSGPKKGPKRAVPSLSFLFSQLPSSCSDIVTILSASQL